jgi:hypothetical protein
VLLVGTTWSESERDALRARFPSLGEPEELDLASIGAHPSELDLVITDELPVQKKFAFFGPYLERAHVICFARQGAIPDSDRDEWVIHARKAESAAFDSPPVNPLLVNLRDEYADQMGTAIGATVLLRSYWGMSIGVDMEPEAIHQGALLTSVAPRSALALAYLRGGTNDAPRGLAWIPGAENRLAWIEGVVALWAEHIDGEITWRDQVEWMTSDEIALRNALYQIRVDRERLLAASRTQESELLAALAKRQSEADAGPRQLLTAASQKLVVAVASAFEAIGFLVEIRDDQLSENAPKREDLVLQIPGSTEWIALVEVRAYSKGSAKQDDLRRLERFKSNYERESGRRVSSLVYVVNAQTELPPAARNRLFSSMPELHASLADDGVLVIDTRDLFLILREDDEGLARALDALHKGAGVFHWLRAT